MTIADDGLYYVICKRNQGAGTTIPPRALKIGPGGWGTVLTYKMQKTNNVFEIHKEMH